ncbi:MAG: FAD-dependent oxidoreductase [Leptolyngbyaceae cyanobacterium]
MSHWKVPVCPVDKLSAGQMQQFTVEGRDILLARKADGYFAVGAHCSHKGAALEQGVLCEHRVVCPWHNACYSLKSGELLEPPGSDHLTSYPVQIEQDTVYVELPVSEVHPQNSTYVEAAIAGEGLQTPDYVRPQEQQDDRTFAIVGGGAAGEAAADMLRQSGFCGRIVIFTTEEALPYDRTTLSKSFLQQDSISEPSPLRQAEFFAAYDVEMIPARVTKLDVEARQLTYGEGKTLTYDAVLLATGGKVQQLPIPGTELTNVFTLRQVDDATEIFNAAQQAQRAVVVGGGFIGMEVAASLNQKDLQVTVVGSSQEPFEKILGSKVGAFFRRVHEDHGVQFKLGTKADKIVGESAVEGVVLTTGETLPADLVIVGIGVEPATDWLDSDWLNEGDRSVRVDQYLKAAPNIYAAGDIVQYPDPYSGQRVRIEHWRLARQQGRTAARNMLGQSVPFTGVPFFWTGQYDLKLRYVGHAEAWDDVIIHGSLDEPAFLAFYVQAGRIQAVAGVGRDRDIAAISQLIRLQQLPPASALQDEAIDWVAKVPQ